ncbi:hypothetical protein F5B22DRAFT_637764 [Xylaria bambusicola]|uniref:uncharacterized protein n=1 Tax=Xylaria bambusicola TaxID=326684 RepID=UPI0020085842|nr:uncharacterized protein F5B22DRAFT_637764 [Xylaria bambusicola]KAI0512507.1 hypothetical protein F5B22DRAFT_637764 [Xylaria bambusicola]
MKANLKTDVDEMLDMTTPSTPRNPSTPLATPTITRIPSWKQKPPSTPTPSRRLSHYAKKGRSRPDTPKRTDSHRSHVNEEDHPKQVNESRHRSIVPSPRRSYSNPFQRSPSLQSLPSTPQQPPSRPLPRNPASAPAKISTGRNILPKDLPQKIDEEIMKKLKSALGAKEKKYMRENKIGTVYLWSVVPMSEPDRTILKIGSTERLEKERLDDIKSTCRHKSIEPHLDPKAMPFILFRRAEKLVQMHLQDLRYNFSCQCPKSHREYFSVDKDAAQKVIQCWRKFCASNPYDTNGELLPFWKHRLGELQNLRHWRDREHWGLNPLDGRLRRWEVFTNPSLWDKFIYYAPAVGLKAWEKRLHFISVFEALIIVFFATPPPQLFTIWILIVTTRPYWK